MSSGISVRTASTASALMIGLALVTVVAVLGDGPDLGRVRGLARDERGGAPRKNAAPVGDRYAVGLSAVLVDAVRGVLPAGRRAVATAPLHAAHLSRGVLMRSSHFVNLLAA